MFSRKLLVLIPLSIILITIYYFPESFVAEKRFIRLDPKMDPKNLELINPFSNKELNFLKSRRMEIPLDIIDSFETHFMYWGAWYSNLSGVTPKLMSQARIEEEFHRDEIKKLILEHPITLSLLVEELTSRSSYGLDNQYILFEKIVEGRFPCGDGFSGIKACFDCAKVWLEAQDLSSQYLISI